MHGGLALSVNLPRTVRALHSFRSELPPRRKELIGRLSKAASCPRPQRKAPQTLPRREGGGSQKPSLRLSLSLSSLAQLYGRHMETVSIYPAPPGCGYTLCSSERKPWIPRRAVAEAACKAASCFAGSVWALLHQRCHLCKQVILVRRPALWLGRCSQTWRQSFCCCFESACPSFRLVSQSLLLPVILVHLPGLLARTRGE